VSPGARVLAALIFAFCWTCLLRQLVTASPAPLPVVACSPALQIAGHLHCGPAAIPALERACGPAAPALAVSGDAIGPGCAVVGRMAGADLEALGVPLDVNAASLAELESLPGIGPRLAERITAARPFHRVDELLRVHGIGPVRLAALRRRVRVKIPAPAGS